MFPVKLPYYPKLNAQQKETRFGAIEITPADIYTQPIEGKKIIRVDLLYCLRDTVGPECFINRKFLYYILSGEPESCTVEELFASFYRRYPTLRTYVNDCYYFRNPEVPIVDRCVLPLRKKVNEYKDEMMQLLSSNGGKYLALSRDYLYYAFNDKLQLPDLEGVLYTCLQ